MPLVKLDITHENGEKVSIEKSFPESIQEVIDAYDEDITYWLLRVGFKAQLRQALSSMTHNKDRSKSTLPENCQAAIDAWNPSVGSERGKGGIDAVAKLIKKLNPEQRAALASQVGL